MINITTVKHSNILVLCAGVSAAFAVKLFKSWINEKDINSVATNLRKVGMDNRLMVKKFFPNKKKHSSWCLYLSYMVWSALKLANKKKMSDQNANW